MMVRATRLIAILVLLTVVALAVVGCGGSGIPDDVTWRIVGSMEPALYGGGNYRVRLNKPVSEEVLRAIGKEVKSQHVDTYLFEDSPTGRYQSESATVRVWFYLPEMSTQDVAWGEARFTPDNETVEIWGDR